MTLFTEAEQQRIQNAVAQAEGRTAGEIVPYIVTQSSGYEVAVWRGGSLVALLTLGLSLLLTSVYSGWGLGWLYTNWGIALATLGGATVGALLTTFVSPLKRWLTGDALLAETVNRRAMQAFVEEEIFKTRDRTGILLFLSLFEHRIEVLGDEGINQKVTPDEWVDVVMRIRKGIKEDHLADGLVEAIEQCGQLLEKRGVEIQPDDTDELSNKVRIRDEG